MAPIFFGFTTCVLCRHLIHERDDIVSFTAFLPHTHRLWEYSDSLFHSQCFYTWAHREEFLELYSTWRRIYASRPQDAKTDDQRRDWFQEAFKDIPPWDEMIRNQTDMFEWSEWIDNAAGADDSQQD